MNNNYMPQNYLKTILISVISVLIIAAGLVAFFSRNQNQNQENTPTTQPKINVVVSGNFWGDIATQIGGDKVTVTSIISDPGTDPHLFEPSAANALDISKADIIIKNGLGYDEFIDKVLLSSPNSNRTVISVEQIMNIQGEDVNPHLWYNIPKINLVAEAIKKEFSQKSPANEATFAKNLTTFNNSLQPIIDVINNIKTKYANTPVAYTERVSGYLLSDAGLNVQTPEGFSSAVEEGNDPSPSDIIAFKSLIEGKKIKVLLYNAQAENGVTQDIRNLATQYNIPVIAITETLPTTQANYQSWQLNQVTSLLNALAN